MKAFIPLSVAVIIPFVLAGCASQPTNPTGDFVGVNGVVDSSGSPLVVAGRYQVKTGDTVSKIAKEFNVDWRELSKFNQLDSKHTIYAGQWLSIPHATQVGGLSIEQASLSVQTSSTVVEVPTPIVEVGVPSVPVQVVPILQSSPVVVQTPSPALAAEAVSSVVPVVASATKSLPSPVAITAPAPVVAPTPTATTASVVPAFGLGFANPNTNNTPSPPVPQIQPPNFIYPVGQDNLVVKGFGVPIPNGKTEGIFFVGNVGDSIVASDAGTVVYANASPTATNRPMVVIDHNNGHVSTYFDVGAILVKVGDNVKQGDRLGSMTPQTKSGKALFEFRIAQNGRYIDPMGVIKWTTSSGI